MSNPHVQYVPACAEARGTYHGAMTRESHRVKKPILLTVNGLMKPVTKAHERLDEIAVQAADEGIVTITMQGLFVLAVSTVEVMLTDVLKHCLVHIPEKLDCKDAGFTK